MPFLNIIVLILTSIWIYFDAKNWRRKGVNIYPAVPATGFLIFYLFFASLNSLLYILSTGFLKDFIFNWRQLSDLVFWYLPILISLGIYFLKRKKYQRIAKQGNPPLPPAPWASTVLFVLVLVSSIIFVVFLLTHLLPIILFY